MRPRHIGIDLDNTLIDFDAVFPVVGLELGLLPNDRRFQSKDEVKSFLHSGHGDEEAWMRLQGQVYGRFIDRARLHEGAGSFLRMVRRQGCRLSIVSHKTKLGHFDPHKVDLWNAALHWLEINDFFSPSGFGMNRTDVHFAETRKGKLDLIKALECEIFIDDLPEVLNDPGFPHAAIRMWFATNKPEYEGSGLVAYRTWTEVAQALERLV